MKKSNKVKITPLRAISRAIYVFFVILMLVVAIGGLGTIFYVLSSII